MAEQSVDDIRRNTALSLAVSSHDFKNVDAYVAAARVYYEFLKGGN